jgi:hypothetical protein
VGAAVHSDHRAILVMVNVASLVQGLEATQGLERMWRNVSRTMWGGSGVEPLLWEVVAIAHSAPIRSWSSGSSLGAPCVKQTFDYLEEWRRLRMQAHGGGRHGRLDEDGGRHGPTRRLQRRKLSWPSPPQHNSAFPAAEQALQIWARRRQLPPTEVQFLLGLLDREYLLALPLPSGVQREEGPVTGHILRYLFRRQAAHLLDWGERRLEGSTLGFSEEINSQLRQNVYPDP